VARLPGNLRCKCKLHLAVCLRQSEPVRITEQSQAGELGVRPNIEYEITVDKRSFTGKQIAYGLQLNFFSSSCFTQTCIDRYPAGIRVLVYYDPLLPDQCVLESGWARWTLAPMLWAMLILGGCAGALLSIH
jgi:hypothetical protein